MKDKLDKTEKKRKETNNLDQCLIWGLKVDIFPRRYFYLFIYYY